MQLKGFKLSCNSFLLFTILIFLFSPAKGDLDERRAEPAGVAIHPTVEHNLWQKEQLDPYLSNEDKIKSTINTFFLIKYESWKRGVLLDFDFLFDKNNNEAFNDYAFERGLMHYLLTGFNYTGVLLKRYEYKPNYYKIVVEDGIAKVTMRPNADIVTQDAPDTVFPSPWVGHGFKLIFSDNRWIIQDLLCDDENHTGYPQGHDFNQEALSLLRELYSRESPKDVEIPRAVEGEYLFRKDEKTLFGSFSIQGRLLFVKLEQKRKLILYPKKRGKLEFLALEANGQLYDFQFKINLANENIKCTLKTVGCVYEGRKLLNIGRSEKLCRSL